MVTLTYPYTSPTVTLELPNPRLGNAIQLEEDFSIDWAASGRVYTYKKAVSAEKLLLTFEALSFTQLADLKLFLYSAVNNMSGYEDYKLRTWQGIFMNNPFEKSQDNRNYGSITLEFRGVRI